MSSPQWRFDRFRLDLDHVCRWRGEQAIALPPKAFDLLHYLVTPPDRLVTKDELLDAVRPQIAVSDGVMRMAIGAWRKVLGDTAQTPRGPPPLVGRAGRRHMPTCNAPWSSPELHRWDGRYGSWPGSGSDISLLLQQAGKTGQRQPRALPEWLVVFAWP